MMALDRSPIRVVGRYALYNEIAAGGMATIHLGRLLGPVGFARTVAVKRLHPQFAKDPEFVSMFLDEARLAARVQHPNVVATIDVVATDGELFLIMDYVRGESLSKILRTIRKQNRRVPPRIAAAIMCGFLHGLHSAHEAKNERGEPLGLVHRDVSPQNVLVGSDGIARVLDFGIAKAQGRIQVTRDGQIKGKLAYMPPEQLAGRELSRAVDIYASAVVMWETLTGERLFKGDTEGETLAKILRDPVLAPTAVVPDLPKSFDAPLLKSLSRDASKRHATAKELALELERCCGIASPTEVGEWVEDVVGHVLNAREAQIAEIESSSVGMSISEDPSESDSDLSLPSSRAIRAAGGSPIDTLPMGSGPPVSGRRIAPPTPTAPMTPRAAALAAPAGDEGTGSRSRSGLTGTMLNLPVDRKLPILASIGGVVVLFAVVGVVLAGKFSSGSGANGPAASSASVTAIATSVPSASSGIAPANTDRDIPDPPPSVTGSTPEEPAEDDTKPATTTTTATTTSPAKPPVAAHPTPKAPSPPKPTASPPPTSKKSCDPPYTIDATGRKKYKLECM
ncbi:MAG: serine/threonine protein kinase [Labilithrix sp.]|nr:serine/threonine protein kinase [Labilithrix sp.]MCW5834241.1 serine/threonine protein kinase [Labilithrix sp.]